MATTARASEPLTFCTEGNQMFEIMRPNNLDVAIWPLVSVSKSDS